MKDKLWYVLWGAWYILCAGLGFIPDAVGFGKVVLVATALIFFVPGAVLLVRGLRTGNRKTVLRIRWISLSILVATLILIVSNVCSVGSSETMGNVLFVLLGLCSAPMFCGQYWLLSLFLWGCLLTGSFQRPKKV